MAQLENNITSEKSSSSRMQRAYKAIAEWQTRRQTALQLKKLSERQLTDIGVTRAEIDIIASSLSKTTV